MAAHESLGPQFNRMYHVTLSGSESSIEKHGLNNEHAEIGPWDNVDDYDSGAYLWDHPKHARAYAQDLADNGESPVVYKVNAQGLDVKPDLTGSSRVEGAWHVPHVPPDRLKRLVPSHVKDK